MTEKSNKNIIFMMITILIIVIGVVLLVIFGNNGSDKKNSNGSLIERSVDKNNLSKDTEKKPVKSNDNAKVQIVEFGDYKCPACRAFETNFMDKLDKDYIQKGKVEYRFVNAPFHGEGSELGAASSHAVNKVNPKVFWDYHRALFEKQPENHDMQSDKEWLTKDIVKEEVNKLKINQTEKEKIMGLINNQDSTAYKEVENDKKLNNKYEIEVTPTIIVDGEVLKDPMDYKNVSKAIDNAIKKKNK